VLWWQKCYKPYDRLEPVDLQLATVRRSTVVFASPEEVWKAMEDINSYVAKFEPHTLSFETDPSGPLSVGQKVHAVVAGGRKGTVDISSEITEVVPGKKVVETVRPNEFFRRMVETVTLGPAHEGTRVSIEVEYEPKGIVSWFFARRALGRNFAATLSNVKKAFEADSP